MKKLLLSVIAVALLGVGGSAFAYISMRPSAGERLRATQVSMGDTHACAVSDSGSAYCWGQNDHGQLGNGTTTNSSTPVLVQGLASGVTAVTASSSHSCAIHDGAAKCWGFNNFGQLGNETMTDSATPVAVIGLTSGVTSISANLYRTCAVQIGAVKCWGGNSIVGFGPEAQGLLGDGTTELRPTPFTVPGLDSGMKEVSVGDYHSCALTDAGVVGCWGVNNSGQLGDGTVINRNSAARVLGLNSPVVSLSAGFQTTCVVTEQGGAMCWGRYTLGDGSLVSKPAPTQVFGMEAGMASISTNDGHTCALSARGSAYCWGDNPSGQFGNGSTSSSLIPYLYKGMAVCRPLRRARAKPALPIMQKAIPNGLILDLCPVGAPITMASLVMAPPKIDTNPSRSLLDRNPKRCL